MDWLNAQAALGGSVWVPALRNYDEGKETSLMCYPEIVLVALHQPG